MVPFESDFHSGVDDLGILTFKGTRFIRSDRNKEIQNHVT